MDFPANPWFDSLPPTEAQALLAATRPLRLRTGQCAWRQGDSVSDHGMAFFGVLSGRMKASAVHLGGNESVLTVLEPGSWIGEVPILDPHPRHYTLSAMVDSTVLGVTLDDFMALMQRGGFALGMARLLASRTRIVWQMLNDLGTDTPVRIARRLLMLAHGDGLLLPDGRVELNASKELLAQILNLSRPTLTRELQALADTGAIALHYGRIEILDETLLRRCASLDAL
jgi:CRP/FNR family transcriptional regulator, cyclic AMP receptor protein